MPFKTRFRQFIRQDYRQLRVNEYAEHHEYTMTCYHSEQLAEKVVKDKLTTFGIPLTKIGNYSHDLALAFEDLWEIVSPPDDEYRDSYKEMHDQSVVLTKHFVFSRYPRADDLAKKVYEGCFTRGQAEQARAYARCLVGWADSLTPIEYDPVKKRKARETAEVLAQDITKRQREHMKAQIVPSMTRR